MKEATIMQLKDKVAIVTGASRGIGAAIAKRFAAEGAHVVVCYNKSEKGAEQVLAEIGTDHATLAQADLTDEAAVKRLVALAHNISGSIDILVNNAGAILRPGDWQTDEKTWQATLDANLTTAWLMTKHIAPLMQRAGTGAILNIGSVYGELGAAPVLAYTAAKGGIITLTKAMAKELAPAVRVNALSPSNVWTDMTKGAGEELIEFFRQETPLKRIAEPKEIAAAALFLCSDESSYITGINLRVDGGYTLK
jgi:NAD(P)-dependent dehydrogenase (short-subunit alcohol dehydrogenase family)